MEFLKINTVRVAAMAFLVAVSGSNINSAIAAPVTYDYTGTVISFSDGTGQFAANGITWGTTFSGQFTYDPTAASTGGYALGGFLNYPSISVTLNIDGVGSAVSSSSSIQLYNDNSSFGDGANFYGYGMNNIGGGNLSYDNASFTVGLLDYTRTVFDSLELPLALQLSDFNSPYFYFGGSSLSGYDYFYGSFDSLSVSAVPLPPSAILFGTALLGLAGLRRRRNKTA